MTTALYILRDDDPSLGYYSAQTTPFDPRVDRRTISEVRLVEEFPQDVLDMALTGGLPVDENHSNDSTWIEWWRDARTVWLR